MTAVQTDKSNTEGITPALAGCDGDDDLHIAPIGPKDPNGDIIASSDHPTNPTLDLKTNVLEKNEDRDATIGDSQGLDRQIEQAGEETQETAENGNVEHQMDDKPYSAFTHNEKKIIIICVGLSQFFSPVSGQIYFPSLDAIASDLHVSNTLVNLTITTYLASDRVRLRPKYTY